MAESRIVFYQGTQSQYNGLNVKDENGIYFLSDTQSIYKGSTKYGGGDVEIATSDSAGIVKPGSDFDVAADGTITLYKAIDLTSFTNTTGTVEKGTSVSSTNLSWAVNKEPATIKLQKGTETYPVSPSDRSTSITFSPAISTDTSFTIVVTDNRSASDTMTTRITFLNGCYYGIGTVTESTDVTNSFVQGLTKVLASSRQRSFTVTANAGQYIYYALPSSFGTPSFFVGGFEGGFELLKTFNYENSKGYSESYNVYKSVNANLGETTVEVR